MIITITPVILLTHTILSTSAEAGNEPGHKEPVNCGTAGDSQHNRGDVPFVRGIGGTDAEEGEESEYDQDGTRIGQAHQH